MPATTPITLPTETIPLTDGGMFRVTAAPTPAKLVPWTVHGGFRMAYQVWEWTEDGWDCEWDTDGLPATIFATQAECEAAIAERLNRFAMFSRAA